MRGFTVVRITRLYSKREAPVFSLSLSWISCLQKTSVSSSVSYNRFDLIILASMILHIWQLN
jgi:hypothetical protein